MSADGGAIGNASSGLPEIDELLQLVRDGGPHLSCRTLCEVATGGRTFAFHAVTLGNSDRACPAVGFFGGVHGLERIGAEVVLACLRSLVRRLRRDTTLHQMLAGLRVLFVPVVNPGGLWRGTRANPQGVDLMRNAPVDCADRVPFLLGGQRISAGLLWYRGVAGAAMQPEAQALCDIVTAELLGHDFSLGIDCHSGFGLHDRLWFPHAHTARPIEQLPELHALSQLLDDSLLHHRYLFEPQSRQYMAHGDLWDHLYLRALANGGRVFLPLTLEMGSWLWVKKKPAPALLAPRHLQPADRAPAAARAAAPPVVAGLRDARGLQPHAVAAASHGPRSAARERAGPLVPAAMWLNPGWRRRGRASPGAHVERRARRPRSAAMERANSISFALAAAALHVTCAWVMMLLVSAGVGGRRAPAARRRTGLNAWRRTVHAERAHALCASAVVPVRHGRLRAAL